MSAKKEPMLIESPITKRIYIITKYKLLDNGSFQAKEKFDVTEEFDVIARKRMGKGVKK